MTPALQRLLVLVTACGVSFASLVPQQRANICGVRGYDRGRGNYDYDDSGKYNTFATCRDHCLADTKCKSFGFSASECMLFSLAVTGNFDADKSSSDIYYDRGCLVSTSSSTSSSTGIKAATSTTSASTSKAATTSRASSLSSTKQLTATTLSTVQLGVTSSSSTSTASSDVDDDVCSAATATTTPTTSRVAIVTSSASSTTSKASTSSTSRSSASPSASTVAIPAECASTVQPTLSMTTFKWFNSTHNLDCANPNSYPSTAQVCWNSSNALCNSGDPGCTCTPYCYTGLPSAAYQPLGYGPPDTISIAFSGASTGCSAANPQSIRRYEIGEGHFDCGSAADYIGFTGDSNKDTGGVGSVYYNSYGTTCGGRLPRYTATFPLICSRDAGKNATCTASLPVTLTLASLS